MGSDWSNAISCLFSSSINIQQLKRKERSAMSGISPINCVSLLLNREEVVPACLAPFPFITNNDRVRERERDEKNRLSVDTQRATEWGPSEEMKMLKGVIKGNDKRARRKIKKKLQRRCSCPKKKIFIVLCVWFYYANFRLLLLLATASICTYSSSS